MSLLESFLYLLLHIAVILFIAACVVWILRWVGIAIDPLVYKVGTVIVLLLILIAVVAWLSGFTIWPWQPIRRL